MREIPKEPDGYDSVARYPVEVDELRNCILLVDDSPEIRHSLRRMFEHAGWEVCGEAANGLKAIEEAARLQPHLIVLDVAMPEMNGLTAARILKRAMPKVHLILFTMHGNLITADEAASAGVDAVFSKTEPVSALLKKAQSLLSPEAAA